MCQSDTRSCAVRPFERVRRIAIAGVVLSALSSVPARAQNPVQGQPDWRRIGSTVVELELASQASGPAERVWYSADGTRLFVRTAGGRVYETGDFEKWQASSAVAPPAEQPTAGTGPEGGRGMRVSPTNPLRLYAWGGQILRSDDGGLSWTNMTAFGRRSVIGGEVRDLAVSPLDAADVVAANDSGVWRSLDGGTSWAGLNDSLPNLPGRRITALPRGAAGVRLQDPRVGIIEWAPGEKQAWRVVNDAAYERQEAERRGWSGTLGAEITAAASSGEFVYAGSDDGRLWASGDRGRTWIVAAGPERGAAAAVWVDEREPRLALVVFARSPQGSGGARVLRTVNGGQFWDDLTSDLPDGAVHGIAADRSSGTVYVATDSGVFLTKAELSAAGPATLWTPVKGLPDARALDVKLDAEGNQFFVLMEGYGVYAALAPHRLGALTLVSAADFSRRAAAPGSLISVLGGRVVKAQAGGLNVPVLAASDSETQIQVPFAVSGSSLALALETGQRSYRVALPLEDVSPAIFVDRDGTPLIMNADTGVLLDAMNTAHSNTRIQLLTTGLGRVRPEWPAGTAGPLDNPPQVVAPVRVFVDRAPVEVTRAVLAPGYIGLYLVEAQLPALVNSGPAELYVESEGRESNRARIWIEP